MGTENEYYAFISYKEEDYKMAKWLQHRLEHYHLPSAIRKKNPALPKRISPIFEYKSEMSGGYLEPSINAALEESKYLIVICSPNAPKSIWVADEVQKFINAGKTDYIIPFIIAGEAYSKDPKEECFPEPLRKLKEPLRGISINELGRDAAAIKVVAQMFGLRFDNLWQRYERELRKRRWIWGCLAILLALTGLVIALFFNHQNTLIKEKDRGMQEALSRAIAEKIHSLIEEGDLYTAQLLALEILPDSDSEFSRPYTPEAEKALREALEVFERDRYKQVSVLKGRDGFGGPDDIMMSKHEDVAYFVNGGYLFKHYLETGKELQFESKGIKNRFGLPGLIDDETSLCLNMEETKLCAIDYGTYAIWDARNGRLLQKGEFNINNMDDTDSLLSAMDKTFIYDETSYNPLVQIGDLPNEIRQRLSEDCYNIYRSKSGKYIIADGKVFSAETRSNILMSKLTDTNSNLLEFSKDNRLIAIGDINGNVDVIDINSSEVVSTHKAAYKEIKYIDFSEDGKKLFRLSNDSLSSEIAIYDIKGGMSSHKIIPKVQSVSVNWGSRHIVLLDSLHNDSVFNWSIWDISNNQLCNRKEYKVADCESMDLWWPFWNSSDCILYLSQEGMMINRWYYEINSIETSCATPMYTMGNGQDYISSIHPVDKDRILLIAGQGDHQVMDRNTLDLMYPIKHEGLFIGDSIREREGAHIQQYIAASRVSQDGKRLLTVSYGGVLRVYDIDTGLMLQLVELPLPNGIFPHIDNWAISYDGRMIAYCAYDEQNIGRVYLLELPTLQDLINKTKRLLNGRKLTQEEKRRYYLN